MNIKRPLPTEFPEYFADYIKLVENKDVFRAMELQILSMQAFLSEIPEERENFIYAEGKWTLKEVIGHVLDTERILAYAALRFSRNDKTDIPGFNAQEYVKHSKVQGVSLYDLAHDFGRMRDTNLALFRAMSEEQLDYRGRLNEKVVTVRALIYFIAGHSLHHINVIRRKYLVISDED